MPKESQNVDKRCTFSSLVSSYNHLYAKNDKSKTTLVCGTPTCIRSRCLWGLISLKCDMRPYKQTRSDTSSCSTHSCGFPIILHQV